MLLFVGKGEFWVGNRQRVDDGSSIDYRSQSTRRKGAANETEGNHLHVVPMILIHQLAYEISIHRTVINLGQSPGEKEENGA